jgi:hypothetical protein
MKFGKDLNESESNPSDNNKPDPFVSGFENKFF